MTWLHGSEDDPNRRPNIDDHDLDGHGGHRLDCRQCRIAAAEARAVAAAERITNLEDRLYLSEQREDAAEARAAKAADPLLALVATWRKASPIHPSDSYDIARAAAFDQCADELDALLAAPVASGWQPIETAPKDIAVLVYCENGPWAVGHLNTTVGAWVDGWEHRKLRKPSHWMLLPTAPVASAEDETP